VRASSSTDLALTCSLDEKLAPVILVSHLGGNMRRLLLIVAPLLVVAVAEAADGDRVGIRMDTAEADAVLAVLDKAGTGAAVTDSDWGAIYATEGYRRLKQREAAIRHPFTDEEFREFVLHGEAVGRAAELRRTLAAWQRADFDAIAARILAYLPAGATITATIYPVIKPKHNSFVWELDRDPAIFFYLDPEVTGPKFENTAAHELHHVGLRSVAERSEELLAALPENARRAADWMGAFGEGLAMLAAAGSPDVHPHATSVSEDRERWDRDMANVPADLRRVEQFLTDVLEGTLDETQARERGMELFGVQGPWYTVGYAMASAVERRYGRAALLRCMVDPRALLATWNTIAPEGERWSETLLSGVGARPVVE